MKHKIPSERVFDAPPCAYEGPPIQVVNNPPVLYHYLENRNMIQPATFGLITWIIER